MTTHHKYKKFEITNKDLRDISIFFLGIGITFLLLNLIVLNVLVCKIYNCNFSIALNSIILSFTLSILIIFLSYYFFKLED